MQTVGNSLAAAAEPASRIDNPPRHKHVMRRWTFPLAAVVICGGLILGLKLEGAGWFDRLFGNIEAREDLHTLSRMTLDITLTEDGELTPRESAKIKCEVEGQSTILYVVEESTLVKKGDLLIELASDALEERKRNKQMEVDRIKADYEAAVAELEIQESQNAANIKAAGINFEVALLDLEKYLSGDFIGRLNEIDLNIKQSNMDINRKETELMESNELRQKGWITENEIEDRMFALEVARMTLKRHQLSKEILLKYEKPKIEKQRRSSVDKTESTLEDEKKRAASRINKSKARVDQYAKQLENSLGGLKRINRQIEKCKMYAPADGVVQYPVEENWGRSMSRIAIGESVHKGKTLVVLPDTSRMMAKTRIHEADRHFIHEGLHCIVKVPAVPGETFTGKIIKIDKFADSENRWLNPNLKEHGTEILLDDTDAPLSPGDSAEIKILIDTIENVLAVPVQCVVSRGVHSYVFNDDNEPVEVKLGRSNTNMIEIQDGLHSGDRVLMHIDEPLLAKLPAIDAAGKARPPRPSDEAKSAG